MIALAVRKLGRPIKLLLSRSDEQVATNATPNGQMHVKIGAKHDGTLTALEADIAYSSGCYPSSPLGPDNATHGKPLRHS